MQGSCLGVHFSAWGREKVTAVQFLIMSHLFLYYEIKFSKNRIQVGRYMQAVLLVNTLGWRRRRRNSLQHSQRGRNQGKILSYPAVRSWGKCCLSCFMHLNPQGKSPLRACCSTTRHSTGPGWDEQLGLCWICEAVWGLTKFGIHSTSLNYPGAHLRIFITKHDATLLTGNREHCCGKHQTCILGSSTPMKKLSLHLPEIRKM